MCVVIVVVVVVVSVVSVLIVAVVIVLFLLSLPLVYIVVVVIVIVVKRATQLNGSQPAKHQCDIACAGMKHAQVPSVLQAWRP